MGDLIDIVFFVYSKARVPGRCAGRRRRQPAGADRELAPVGPGARLRPQRRRLGRRRRARMRAAHGTQHGRQVHPLAASRARGHHRAHRMQSPGEYVRVERRGLGVLPRGRR